MINSVFCKVSRGTFFKFRLPVLYLVGGGHSKPIWLKQSRVSSFSQTYIHHSQHEIAIYHLKKVALRVGVKITE